MKSLSTLKKKLPRVSAPRLRKPQFVQAVPDRVNAYIREKAIDQARTRIAIAGSDPREISQVDLEIIVKEEEDRIKSSIKEKGLLAVLAVLGINLFG